MYYRLSPGYRSGRSISRHWTQKRCPSAPTTRLAHLPPGMHFSSRCPYLIPPWFPASHELDDLGKHPLARQPLTCSNMDTFHRRVHSLLLLACMHSKFGNNLFEVACDS